MSSETARLFNSTIAATAIAATFRLGFLEELERGDPVRLTDFCARHDVDPGSLRALVCALQFAGVVRFDEAAGVVSKGAAFAEAYAEKGYFYWLVAGYGPMLQHLAELAVNGSGNGPLRNGAEIARAARDYGAAFVDRQFMEVLESEPFEVVADVGCGSAERLIQLARQLPDLRGVGVDIDDAVVELAKNRIAAAGLEGRLAVVPGDLKTMDSTPECEQVQVIFSLFMGHDLWPRPGCVEALARVRRIFPNAGRFLLCDTYRSDALTGKDIPIFTLGFELTHAVMRQYIPSVPEWMEVFEESGWTCAGRRDVDIPFSCIFDLRPA